MAAPRTPFKQMFADMCEMVRGLVDLNMSSEARQVIWAAALENHGWTVADFGQAMMKEFLYLEEGLVGPNEGF